MTQSIQKENRIKEIKFLIDEKIMMMNQSGANEEALNDQIHALEEELEKLESE